MCYTDVRSELWKDFKNICRSFSVFPLGLILYEYCYVSFFYTKLLEEINPRSINISTLAGTIVHKI
jgi:hypothetical protein